MGGAQVVVLVAGFVRAKIIAVVFGAAGIGLIGVLNGFNGNISSFTGWGLATSGVRVIAGAPETDKPSKISAVRYLGRHLSWVGLGIVVLSFWPVGRATFASDKYTLELAVAGLAVPCLVASAAWSAILQAAGRLKTLAKVQVIGAIAGLLIGLPLIYFVGTLGVALSIFLAAAVPAIALWDDARRHCPTDMAPANESDVRYLLQLGGALMIVGWLAQLSAYVVRLIIIRGHGLEAAGYYQASYAIAGSLPGFVFVAMGVDFFPRISAAKDEAEAAHLAEKQIQAGLLLGLPLLAGLQTMGRFCLHLLYDDSFDAAIPLLSWMVWGIFLRLIAWPLGYWLLARGSASTAVGVETVGNALAIIFPLVLLPLFGLTGAAIGFCASYVVYALVMIVVARYRSGIWLSWHTWLSILVSAGALLLAQLSVSRSEGLYWGLLPTAVIAICCFLIYRQAVRHS
jgi:PST family polysaccharide transporter